jgi:hypothetical protein
MELAADVYDARAAKLLHQRPRRAGFALEDSVGRCRMKHPRARQEHLSRPLAAPLSLAPDKRAAS